MSVFGTYEWSVASINCTQGCLNNCNYCYARASAVRQELIKKDSWISLSTRRSVSREQELYNGMVMFPSQHDIFNENIDDCLSTLFNLLGAKNKVLIVSKPRIEPMLQLFYHLADYMNQILFRFTIGCSDDTTLHIWEPEAPSYEERIACLSTAHALGYQTSVSMEPMLDPNNIVADVMGMIRFVTDAIWLGKMNYIRERTRDVPEHEIVALERAYSNDSIQRIYQCLRFNPKIKWKESIKKVVGLPLIQIPGQDQ